MYSHYSEYIGHDALPCAHTRTHMHSVVMYPWATKDIFTFQMQTFSLFKSVLIVLALAHTLFTLPLSTFSVSTCMKWEELDGCSQLSIPCQDQLKASMQPHELADFWNKHKLLGFL